MKAFFQRFSSVLGAAVAAACCLGVPLFLSALGAVGLGFIIHDVYLLPLFAGFVSWNLATLFSSARRHRLMPAFWTAVMGGLLGGAGLLLMVSGRYPHVWPVITGLALVMLGNLWELVVGRRSRPSNLGDAASSLKRNTITGAAISIAAAGVFYEIYRLADEGKDGTSGVEIACWGVNSCKGTTACTTAFNACNGQNACKGKGYLNVSPDDCVAKGGKPLAGSEADPAHG